MLLYIIGSYLLKRAFCSYICIDILGRVMLGYSTAYSCSKFAVEAFTDGLRYEMKPFGITCCLVEPGMFKTDILNTSAIRKQMNNRWKNQSDEVKKEYGESFVNLCK